MLRPGWVVAKDKFALVVNGSHLLDDFFRIAVPAFLDDLLQAVVHLVATVTQCRNGVNHVVNFKGIVEHVRQGEAVGPLNCVPVSFSRQHQEHPQAVRVKAVFLTGQLGTNQEPLEVTLPIANP